MGSEMCIRDRNAPIGSAFQNQVRHAVPSLINQPNSFVRQASCSGCSGGSCGGQCGSSSGHSSGSYGSFSGSSYGGCGIPCDPYHYVIAEGLLIEREGESNFTLSPNFGLPSADFEGGARITIGSLPCLLYTSPSPRDLSTSRMPSSA